MEPINPYSLEEFAERHRADFDLHEPRPELWAGLEQQLDATHAPASSLPRLSIAEAPTPTDTAPAEARPRPVLRTQRTARRYVGIALALTALVLAVSFGENWLLRRPATITAVQPAASTGPEATYYDATETTMLPASQGGPNGNARLDTAVHGMERYYAAQLADRQTQLSQLAPDQQAEWAQDIRGLDSVYQQLKRELPRHPQPEVVLTAMNRNLQIRLDILDRQLELRGGSQLAQSPTAVGSEYALADSRIVADNVVVRRHAH